ncbi:MAG: hypothetical protein R2799_05860 [Crocinitomicaceae bacterium]
MEKEDVRLTIEKQGHNSSPNIRIEIWSIKKNRIVSTLELRRQRELEDFNSITTDMGYVWKKYK